MILELLVIPLQPTAITTQLVNMMFETQLRSFSTMSSVGLIIASLPVQFHQFLYEKAAQMLQDPLLLGTNFYKDREVGPLPPLWAGLNPSANVGAFLSDLRGRLLLERAVTH